jgi:beta-N-acetylhexosaminidase
MHIRRAAIVCVLLLAAGVTAFTADPPSALDRAGEKWVQDTLKKMTLDEKVGQLIATSFDAVYMSADSEAYQKKLRQIRELHVGSVHVFGGSELVPAALLNPAYGSSGSIGRKGDPFVAASFFNRLQQAAAIPLLTTADFEGGTAYILNGGTRLPRAMAIGATRDPQLAYKAGKVVAGEARAVGVTIDFYPVVDVNNNPRNPIINIRSFGEDVGLVTDMAKAYMKGLQDGGTLSTAKHFPGHGDTETDTHLGLPTITHRRERLDKVELAPYRALIDAGVDVVMSTHIILPALDPSPGVPATLSRPILTGLLRDELKFKGLVYTDSMSMYAIAKNWTPDKAAALAVKAGVDFVLHSPDDEAAFRGIKAAVESGEIGQAQLNASVERILRVKAKLGLHRNRLVDLDALDSHFGTRANAAVNAEICEKALTLIKDEKGQVPLKAPKDAQVLYLSVIDYPSGWREALPSRTFIPELKKRWPNVTAVEISDHTTASELDMVRALARRSDLVVAGVFVRIASFSGRMDLPEASAELLTSLAADEKRPLVTVLFGNPYTALALPKLPSMLLAYEFSDAMETAAVRALAGEIPIGGKLPITLPGMFPFGHGLARTAAPARP